MQDVTSPAHPLIVVMGVCGCGKTTVGNALGDKLGIPFRDGDEFHPQANVEKMAAGHPLNDDDRRPWLATISRWLAEHAETGAVVGCSALKKMYRDQIREAAPDVVFCHLAGPMEVSAERVAARVDHFMPASLVQSQYDTLEPLDTDEAGAELDFTLPVDALVDEFCSSLPRKAVCA